jgi:hypothetical protein
LDVTNTTTEKRALEAVASVAAAANGRSSIKDGHQGLAFLCYAARHLFREKNLQAEFCSDLLSLQIR